MKKLVGAAAIVVELFKICDLRGLGLILLGYSMSDKAVLVDLRGSNHQASIRFRNIGAKWCSLWSFFKIALFVSSALNT